jgi:preprotein translocase subunit SecG
LIIAITIIHLIACVFLILVVLLQTGKGAEMGAVFGGGGSSTLFGASGAGNFLTKLTTGTAIVFFLTSLTLAYSSIARTQRTVFDQPLPEPPPLGAPAQQPGPPPAMDDAAKANANVKPLEPEQVPVPANRAPQSGADSSKASGDQGGAK